jgi:2',3'-cyclic-nucleotide 2'-phosphodiesterase (5'-nucleotidase family)
MRKFLFLSVIVATCLFSACASHYRVTGVNLTRILVDTVYDAHPDENAIAFLAPYKQQVDSVMGPVVGIAACDMAADRPEGNLSNLLPDIFVYMAKCYQETPDFAVYNMGGIRAGLVKGEVTYGDILDVAPFENKICFLTLTGDKVLELFSKIAKRGGEGVSKGVQLVITREGKLVSARLHGKEIDPQADYRIATIDYLIQGNDGMPALASGFNMNTPKDLKNNARFIIRDYFHEMLMKGEMVDAKVEGRIVVK